MIVSGQTWKKELGASTIFASNVASLNVNPPLTRQNHYVPIWYQKGFASSNQSSLHYLDLQPPTTTLPDGRSYVERSYTVHAPKSCFWSEDLYTTRFGSVLNDDIERHLFGAIDSDGANAVRAYTANDLAAMHEYFQRFFEYIDAQKLRTPKGLDWIKGQYSGLSQLDLMIEMQGLRQMHCTMWIEGVREIVSAEDSDVKFIVTDHPVSVYNAALSPSSKECRYPYEPGIELIGTQTVFPLDANHCLILSNLEYAKAQGKVDMVAQRTHARYRGSSIARTDNFIRTRKLAADEVRTINSLLKNRARRSWHYLKDSSEGRRWLRASRC